jgi:DNA-directed RNA polymerase I, II, and III subunit RPABC1
MHVLQPKHSKLREEEAKLLLKKFNITKSQLPKMDKTDPALFSMKDVVSGNIIKIERKDSKNPYYRVVA